jgi:hypothetical protein
VTTATAHVGAHLDRHRRGPFNAEALTPRRSSPNHYCHDWARTSRPLSLKRPYISGVQADNASGTSSMNGRSGFHATREGMQVTGTEPGVGGFKDR